MAKAWGLLSLITAILSLGVHLATFVPSVRISMVYVVPLHFVTMLCFVPMVFVVGKRGRSLSTPTTRGFFAHWSESQQRNKEIWAEIAANTPRPIAWILKLAFLYAFINFALFAWLSEGGSPMHQEGEYVLVDHGRILRQLSEAEYHRFQAREVRGFSGHWVIFSLAPAVFFLVTLPRLEKRSAESA